MIAKSCHCWGGLLLIHKCRRLPFPDLSPLMLKPGDAAYQVGASGATNECQVSAIA